MVIYCSVGPSLVCHANYMISDCQCRWGVGGGVSSPAHVLMHGASHGGTTCRESMQSRSCFSPLPTYFCCTSRPRFRPAGDPNLSDAPPSMLHHPRQDRCTRVVGTHNVCFWVADTSVTCFLRSVSSRWFEIEKKVAGKLVVFPSVDELHWSHWLIIRTLPTKYQNVADEFAHVIFFSSVQCL